MSAVPLQRPIPLSPKRTTIKDELIDVGLGSAPPPALLGGVVKGEF